MESAFSLFAVMVNGVFGVFMLRQPNKKLYHWLYSGFSLAVAGVALGVYLFRTTPSDTIALNALTAYHYFGATAALLIFWFAISFWQPSRTRQYVGPLLLLSSMTYLGLLAMIAQPSPNGLVKAVSLSSQGNSFVTGPQFLIAVLLICLFLVGTFWAILRREANTISPAELSIYASIALPLLIGLTFALIFPLGLSTNFLALGPISASFISLFLFYAILRHQLFDIRVMLRKGTVYSALIGLLVVGYLVVFEVMRGIDWQRLTPIVSFDIAWKNSPLLILSLLYGLLAVVVFQHGKREKSSRIFAGLLTAVGFWCFGVVAFLSTDNISAGWFWLRWFYLSAGMIAPFCLHFALSFPGTNGQIRPLKSWQLLTIYAPLLIMIWQSVFNPQHILSVNLSPTPTATAGDQYAIYGFWWLIYGFVYLSVLLQKAYKQRSQALTLLAAGTLLSTLSGLWFNLVLPWRGDYTQIVWGPLLTVVLFVTAVFAILRHQLFDIRLMLRKSAVYSALVAAVFVVYFVIIELVRVLSPEREADPLQGVFLVALGLLALLFPLLKWLEKLSNRLIFAQESARHEALIEFSREMLHLTDPDALAEQLTHHLHQHFAPPQLELWVAEAGNGLHLRHRHGQSELTEPTLRHHLLELHTTDQFDQLLEDATLPPFDLMQVFSDHGRVIGWIGLSAPSPTQPYSLQELRLLHEVLTSFAISLRHALTLRTSEDRLQLREHQLALIEQQETLREHGGQVTEQTDETPLPEAVSSTTRPSRSSSN